MKNELRQLIVGIVIGVLVFCFAAFINMDIDPSNWSKDGRITCVIVWVMFFFALMLEAEYHELNRR